MARKKTVTTTIDDGEELPPESPIELEELPSSVDEAALQRAVEELGADINTVRVVVYRVRPNRDPEECIDCPFDQFTKNALREQFGPGDYLLQLRVKGLIRRKHLLHFAAPVDRPDQLPALSPVPDLGALLERVTLQMNNRFAEMQLASSREMLEFMRSVVARDVTPRVDPLVMQNQLLDQAVKLQELLGRRSGPDDLDRFGKFLTLARDLGGGEGKGASGADVALELMRMAKPVLELSKAAAAADARVASAPSVPESPPMQNLMIRQGLKLLVKNAAADNEPLAYAEVLVDNLPPLALAALLEPDDWFAQLCQLDPAVEPYLDWFTELRDEVLRLTSPAEPAGDLSAPAGAADTSAEVVKAPHVPIAATATRQPGAAAVRGTGSPRDAGANARPGTAIQGEPGRDRKGAPTGSRAPAKGRS